MFNFVSSAAFITKAAHLLSWWFALTTVLIVFRVWHLILFFTLTSLCVCES